MTSNITFVSVNVRGLRDRVKRNHIFQWCKSKESNIVLLQETYSTPDVEESWRKDWDGSMIFNHGTNHSRGVLLLFAHDIDLKVFEIVKDAEGRYICIKCEMSGQKLIIGNFYFPTRDKENLQIDLLTQLDVDVYRLMDQDCSLIFGGDFNTIMNEELDYMGMRTGLKTKFRNLLINFLNKYDLIDIWRSRNLHEKQYTFRQRSPVVQSRLDYWFISSKLERLVNLCDILVSITPDHSGIRLRLSSLVEKYSFGRAYWKFNNSLCEDKVFVEGMNSKIIELERNWRTQFSDKVVFWDFMKMKIREYIICFAREKAKNRRIQIENLEKEIKELEKMLVNTPLRTVSDEIETKKLE